MSEEVKITERLQKIDQTVQEKYILMAHFQDMKVEFNYRKIAVLGAEKGYRVEILVNFG